MKISIYNFKSIGSLVNYEIKPLSILSGTNSSGKSSFIQLLLLLKQTIEWGSDEYVLVLDGKLFPVINYFDILNRKVQGGKLKIELIFNKTELSIYTRFDEINLYEVFDSYELSIIFEFDSKDDKVYLSYFEAKFIVPVTEKPEHFIKVSSKLGEFNIETNVAVFSNASLLEKQGNYKICNINYSAFVPLGYEIEYTENPGSTFNEVLKLDGIRAILKDFFAKLHYIGPYRDEPKEEYRNTGNFITVGIHGEYTAEVFERLSNQPAKYLVLDEENDTIKFVEKDGDLLSAVKYWMCQRFNLCSDIYAKKIANSYIVYIKSLAGVESTIRHVGFGISQLLPVIVEGIRLSPGQTLILEQPEVHLHPKVQSQLFDFLISIVQQGKKVIVETHSDHLITRLRRRIAEDMSNEINDKTSLTFIEPSVSDLLFRNINIDDYGGLDYFPDDFIEKTDVELRAILKAQMTKRLNQKSK